jgi:predicted DNA-binding transcriptional regulator AlpA
MSEQLLSMRELCQRLGRISRSTFLRIEPVLIAKGLQKAMVGRSHVYRESSIDNVIRDLFTQENPTIEVPVTARKEKGSNLDVTG